MLGLPRRLAQKVAFTLRQMGVLQVEGKRKGDCCTGLDREDSQQFFRIR